MERGNTFTDTTCLSLIFVSFLQPGQVYNVKFYWQSVFVCSLENTTPSFLHCWRSHIYISLMLVSTFFGWLFIVSLSALRNLGLLSVGLSHVGRQSWAGQHPGHLFLLSGIHQIHWNNLSGLCLHSEVSYVLPSSRFIRCGSDVRQL